MSVVWLQRVFELSQARGAAYLVALALADRADDAGRCWPGLADIARRARLTTERSARRALKQLVALGELQIQPGGGRAHTNVYTLTISSPETRTGAQGFTEAGKPNRRTDAPCGTRLKPLRAAPETPARGVLKPGPARRGNQQEPSVNHQENRQAPDDVPLQPGAVAVPIDPDGEAFNRLLAERRADAARAAGALAPAPIGSAVSRMLPGANRQPPGPRAACHGRLPESEQNLTYLKLKKVPGLSNADARDLARIGTEAEFRVALDLLGKQRQPPRNVGAWLRTAVTQDWQPQSRCES